MRRSLIVVVAFVLFSAGLAIVATRSSAEPLGGSGGMVGSIPVEMPEVVEARSKFKANDAPGALKLLQEASKKNQDLPPGNVLLAQMFAEARNAAGMRKALEDAVEEAPEDPEAYMFMGNIAQQEHRIAEARMLYEKAFSLLGKVPSEKRKGVLHPLILNGLALVAEAREDWAGAQRQLEAWLALDPKSVPAMQRLALCLFEQKDVEGARAMLQKAFKQDSKMLTPEAGIATFYMRTDNLKASREKAQEWLTTALKANPQDFKVNLLAAQWLWKIGHLKEAAGFAASALKLAGKSRDETLQAQMVSGQIAAFQKDYPAAETFFQTALLLDPDNFDASNNLALAMVEQKDEEKKEKALKYAMGNVRASQQTQNEAQALSTYGWVQFKRKNIEEAERALRMSMSKGFGTHQAYYWACIQNARGRDAEAVKFLQAALNFKGPFAYREEAEAMLKDLQQKE